MNLEYYNKGLYYFTFIYSSILVTKLTKTAQKFPNNILSQIMLILSIILEQYIFVGCEG